MQSTGRSATRKAKSFSNVPHSERLKTPSMPRSFQVLTDRYGIRRKVIMPDMHSFIRVYLVFTVQQIMICE